MNDRQTTAVVQQKRTVADLINSEKMRLEIAKVLPKHVTPERMTRVALTAVMRNPDLMLCTPESLTNSMMLCSQAGLEPDGRLAHLIPRWSSKKNAFECTVIFDYKGLVVLALRNGAESVYADKVCEFDTFDAYVEDGIKKLNHRPKWNSNRGTVACYYGVCKRAGEVDWEVMTVDEVQDVRGRSPAKDKGPWVTDFDEMAKKTVLRRMSKRWDLLPEIRDVINADDDTPPPFGQVTVTPPIFSTPKVLEKPAPESEAPQADAPPDDPGNPEPHEPDAGNEPPVQQELGGNGNRWLKGIRSLAKAGGVKEAEILAHLYASNVTDGSIVDLDSLPSAIQELVYNQWGQGPAGSPGIASLIVAARKGGSK